MYNAEVLSKFPVVQHFPMGSLFTWEKDPAAAEVAKSVHTSHQPTKTPAATARPQPALRDPMADAGTQSTRAPWAGGAAQVPASGTAAPWASSRGPPLPSGPNQPTRAPWTSSTTVPPPSGNTTTAPWAMQGGAATAQPSLPSTRAPWEDRKPQGPSDR